MYRAVRQQDGKLTPAIAPLVRSVFDLDFARQAGVTITLDDIGPVELQGLRILHEERSAYSEQQHTAAQRASQMRPSEID